MIERNPKSGFLEYKEKFELKDIPEPNLLRDMFPFTEIPRITFDNFMVMPELPSEIWITDTTFRDGQQARPPLTVKQIVDIYDMLHKLSGPNGVIRQCEFFLYTEKDREAVRKCLEKGYQYPEVTGWIRAVAADFKLVKDMGLKETGILTSISDYHIFHKLKKSRRKAIDDYIALVKEAAAAGMKQVRCHLEDLTRADFFGCVVPYVQELMKVSEEAKMPVKIRLCDTMGYGVPWPFASLPRSVPKLVWGLRHYCGVPPERLEWHGHNDFHLVLANGTAAWLYGCSALNCTLLGFGERTGNPPLEGAVITYVELTGSENGMNLHMITEIAKYMEKECGYLIPPSMPFVGQNFNVTMAGIHADGIIKDPEIYNIFDTEKILNRPFGVNITDKTGLAGIAFWINHRLGLKGDKRIPKSHPGIAKIEEWVQEQYKIGRNTAISPEELEEQARKWLPEYFK